MVLCRNCITFELRYLFMVLCRNCITFKLRCRNCFIVLCRTFREVYNLGAESNGAPLDSLVVRGTGGEGARGGRVERAASRLAKTTRPGVETRARAAPLGSRHGPEPHRDTPPFMVYG